MMIKRELQEMFWPGVVTLLPMILGIVLWPQLPAELPIHWGINGLPDQYASKLFVVVGLPLFLWVLGVILHMVLVYGQKNNGNLKISRLMKWLTPIMAIVLQPISLFWGLGYQANVGVIVIAFLGILFIVVGNYIPKTTRNLSIGFRLPSTLNNHENWRQTNQIGGKMMVIAGVLMIFGAILGLVFNWLLVPTVALALLLIIVIPTVYSFYLVKK